MLETQYRNCYMPLHKNRKLFQCEQDWGTFFSNAPSINTSAVGHHAIDLTSPGANITLFDVILGITAYYTLLISTYEVSWRIYGQGILIQEVLSRERDKHGEWNTTSECLKNTVYRTSRICCFSLTHTSSLPFIIISNLHLDMESYLQNTNATMTMD